MHEQAFATLLLLWPWPWSDDLHIRTWPAFPGDTRDVQVIELPTWRLSKVIVWHSDRQTYIQMYRQTTEIIAYTTSLRGWSENVRYIITIVQFAPKQFPFLFHMWKLVRITPSWSLVTHQHAQTYCMSYAGLYLTGGWGGFDPRKR